MALLPHAYLIMAHHEPSVLRALLYLLDDERNDIYLHIDSHADELYAMFADYRMQHAGFHIVPRKDCHWGTYEQIEVEMHLFAMAAKQREYAYYHLLSGVDLPLKSQDEIHAFFAENGGKEFVEICRDEFDLRDMKRKIGKYHLLLNNKRTPKSWKRSACAVVRNSMLAIQKVARYERNMADRHYAKGSNWVSITHELCLHLLSEYAWIRRRFRHCYCPDEIFLQSVLANAPHIANIYEPNDGVRANLRFVDWERGRPYTWQDEDVEELLSAPYMFARKFSSTTPRLIETIVERCKSESKASDFTLRAI